jgi:flagellar biosynthesis/type III secretory pathway protein FliH
MQGEVRGELGAGRPAEEAVTFETRQERVVRDYEPRRIIKPGSGSYEFTREKFGPIAASDDGRVFQSSRDSRFRISELSREPLSVHLEEQRAFEARVRDEVAALSREAFEAARKAGHEEGLKLGRDEALGEAREEAKSMLDSISGLFQSLESHRSRLLEQQERFLIEMVLKIARKVCLKEVSLDAAYLGRLAHAMVEQCGTRENVRVRISLQDAEGVGALRQQLAEQIAGLKNLTVEASGSVPAGGCEVETDISAYSASLASQLDAIEKSMLQGGAEGTSSGNAGAGA